VGSTVPARSRRGGLLAAAGVAVLALVGTGGGAQARARHRERTTHHARRGPRCVPHHLGRSAVLPRSGIAVNPLPGSYDALPATQISMLGAPASAFASIRVRGSRSGPHRGRLIGYSQGDGASFIPRRPFRAGETVRVRGIVTVGGRRLRLAFAFAVAHRDRLRHVRSTHPTHDYPEEHHYASRPDLEPPVVVVTDHSGQTAPGYLLASPYAGPGPSGPMIFDDSGALVWFQPMAPGTEATNLQVQQLDGRPVLTWWQGYIAPQGFGQGEEVIDDSSYRTIAHVHAGNGYHADLHDFHIDADGTAVLTAYSPIRCDLSAHGGHIDSAVTDSLVQELDLRTGLVRREWHSLDHVSLGDSYSSARAASRQWPYDYFHLNSIDPDGANTLISARNTSALYGLDTRTGVVLVRIGGRDSNVSLTRGASTAFQHDATVQADGTISVFDNGGTPRVHPQTRALVVALDEHRRTASVVSQYVHPAPLHSGSQGSMQLLENGDAFVGWGSEPYFSEFAPGGRLIFDAHMHGSYQSYRAYRMPWTGAPAHPPAVAVRPAAGGPPGALTVYASWNGDTRTAAWRVLGGTTPATLVPVAGAPRAGFETPIAVPPAESAIAVQALDAAGEVLGTSRTVSG
jgi:hypothetical protein